MISVKAVKIGNFLISTRIDEECKGLFERPDHVASIPSADKELTFQFEETSNTVILEDWKTYFIQTSTGALNEALLAKRGEYISNYLSKIQFTNSIGKSRLGEFVLDVKSRKLSEDEFRKMLEYVEYHACNLSLANFQSRVGYKASRDKLSFKTNPYLKLKFLISNYFKDLQPWLKIIAKNPHRLSTELRYFEEVERIHDFDDLAILEVFSGSSNYIPTTIDSDLSNSIVFNGVKHLPEQINQGEVVDTYNTPENQFVKYFIDSLDQLIKQHGDRYDFASDAMIPRNELTKIRKELQYYSRQNVLRECTQMKQIPFSSQVLMRDTKYKKVLDFYKSIHSVPTLNFSDTPFEEIIELKNIDRLYEYYCFFKLNDIITNLSSFSILQKIELEDNGFEKSLRNSFIEYTDDKICIRLNFKKKYPSGDSYSVELEPDFSVEIQNLLTKQLVRVFFDAKFKFKDGYVNSEDIHKMHTYKDAIDGLSSIVLYPGEHDLFHEDPKSSTPLRGVGAFVLKPDKVNVKLHKYLNEVVKLILQTP
jgi:predicted component of viral defense system (DUF524 family)